MLLGRSDSRDWEAGLGVTGNICGGGTLISDKAITGESLGENEM